MAKKREIIDDGFASIINRKRLNQSDQPARKPNPLGVVLDQPEIDQLTAIAKELGLNRHYVMQYAIRQFIADWQKGKRPKQAQRVITTLETE